MLRGSRMRAAASVFIAATMAAASLLPPSHIHLAEHDHDHSAVEHSHWSSHGTASRSSIDDDDGLAIFVDHPGILTALPVAGARPLAADPALLAMPEPPAFAHHVDRLAGNAPRDGPHLDADTLRGPPLVP